MAKARKDHRLLELAKLLSTRIDELRSAEAPRPALHALLDTLPIKAWVLAPDGRVTFLNHHYTDAGQDISGWLHPKHIHPEDCGPILALRSAAIAAGEPYEMMLRMATPAGWRWHAAKVAPVRAGGEITHWIGTAVNIDAEIATLRVA